MLTKANIIDFCHRAYRQGCTFEELSDETTEVKDFILIKPTSTDVALLVLFPATLTMTELQTNRIRWFDRHGHAVLFCMVDDMGAVRIAMQGA